MTTSGRRLGVGFVIVLAACSVGEAARPARAPDRIETRDFVSGTRLRARAFEVDGVFVLRDFFDRERDEACAFVEDGVARTGPGAAHYCFPRGMALHDVGLGPFSNPTCTTPVGLAVSEIAAGYAITRPEDACASEPVIRRAGKVEVRFPYVLDAGVCVRSSVRLATQALGDVVPLGSFVRAVEQVEDRGSRIGALVVVSPDGARQAIGAFDRERNEAVRIEDRPLAPLRWVPSRVAFIGVSDVFVDAICTRATPAKTRREATCPLTAALVFTDACNAGTVEELGPPLEAPFLATRTDDEACVILPPPPSFLFERGQPIAPESLAPAFAVDVGGDVVRRRGFSGAGGAVASFADLVDARTAQRCSPVVAVDGVRRCLPESATVALFADAACTVSAFYAPRTGCEREPPPRFVSASDVGGARAYAVTGPVAALYEMVEGECRRFTPPVSSQSFAVSELDVRSFPAVTERDDAEP